MLHVRLMLLCALSFIWLVYLCCSLHRRTPLGTTPTNARPLIHPWHAKVFFARHSKTKIEMQDKNKQEHVDNSSLVNGRRMTNIGTFRADVKAYLTNHPMINKEMTLLIRQLAPNEHGLPIEIYVFSKDQEWVNYEGIQSDIFDHILAVVPEFDLRVFQDPSGMDFKRLIH